VTYLSRLAIEMRMRTGEQYRNNFECMKISKGDPSKRHPNETLEVQPAKTDTIACIQWIIWRVNLIK
jgi:hypothetical protein